MPRVNVCSMQTARIVSLIACVRFSASPIGLPGPCNYLPFRGSRGAEGLSEEGVAMRPSSCFDSSRFGGLPTACLTAAYAAAFFTCPPSGFFHRASRIDGTLLWRLSSLLQKGFVPNSVAFSCSDLALRVCMCVFNREASELCRWCTVAGRVDAPLVPCRSANAPRSRLCRLLASYIFHSRFCFDYRLFCSARALRFRHDA